MKKIVLLFCLLATSTSENLFACINYYVVDSSGRRNMHDEHAPSYIYFHTKSTIEALKSTEKAIAMAASGEKYKYISNYCALLIALGRYKDAIPVLEKLMKDKPGEYEVIANLGVAYELDGKIDKALELLKMSLKINPESHRGSEWFHQRILEAAILIRDKKLSPQEVSILKLENKQSNDINIQISYQLHERIPLTKSKNSLLSKVIEESADYYGANLSLEWAIELYATAIGYTSDNSIKTKLWSKINTSRQKLVDYEKQGKTGSVSKYLLKAAWKKDVEKRIRQWDNYTPYYYEKPILRIL